MDCANGDHATLEPREPQELQGCVNIEWVCPACGVVAVVESWTKAAWIEEQVKDAERLVKQAAKAAKKRRA